MTATTPGPDSAEMLATAPDAPDASDEHPTEPFQRIEVAAAQDAGATPAHSGEPAADEAAGTRTGRSPGRKRVRGMPSASPWQRSHAVWHRAGVDWVHAAATIPAADGPAPQAEEFEPEPAEPRQDPAPAASRTPTPAPAPVSEVPVTPAVPVARPARTGALPPSRRTSGGSRRPLLAAAVAAVLVAGAGGYLVLGGEEDAPRRTVRQPGAVLADPWFAVDPAAKTDGLVQQLTGVAGEGATLIAVGGETGGPDRARFLVSADGGRSWRTARVRAADGGEPPPAEMPRRVTGGAGRWVALGGPAVQAEDAAGPTVVWTSKDGLTWTRQPAVAAFGPQDRVMSLARTSTGFMAVGTTDAGDGTRGVLWTSADGSAWQRVDRTSIGDVVTLDRVAASGGTVVVRGTVRKKVTKVERKGGKKRKVTRTVEESGRWRSADGGRTWSQVDVSQAQGSYGALTGLVGGPGGFFATREAKQTTGSKKRRKTVRYSVVWSSPDGARWTPAGRIQPGGYARLERLAGSPAGLAALADVGDGKKAVLRSGDGRTWQRAGEVSGPDIGGMAALGGTVALAGSKGGDGYLALPGTGEVNLATVPGAVRTERAITALVPDGARLVAVGSTNGEPAAWVGPSTRAWQRASGLNGDPDPQTRRWLSDAVRGDDGWLAVGRHGDSPLLFTSTDAATWEKGRSLPGKGFAESAAFGPGGYVAAGQYGRWAAVWHSADLKKWTRGSGAGEGRMRDVTAVPGGYVAVGARPGPKGDRPAAWTSTDGRKWTAVRMPAPPPGAASGMLTRVAARGDVLVAIGSGKTGAPEQPYPFTAVSADGGKTWQVQTLPGGAAGGTVTAVTATPTGHVVAGTTGNPGGKDVAVWSSADGRTWKAVLAHGTGLDGPGDQRLTALAVVGGELVAVGMTGDHRGDTPTFWRTRLP
ncbi:hypothetical protein SAMN04489712_102157 [Thermomonospora echinospora]|uniref:Uncharacterized protein n=1 Tax=Thermomonospora echinospora TaxID=1992 RepID=A0A1H5V3Q4_9ACTN|nr:hypothetical protein [Thermomonospora echinospora]SEF82092.1 hypothetical protein SAMN04489712_102157 [Thermomonospora echinospora]